MPHERKKRGRREEQKRQLDHDEDETQTQSPPPPDGFRDYDHVREEGTFFGLLDDQELAYFASLNSLLVSDEFEGDEERNLFIDNTFAEVQGRELKIATSPSSRFLEKLIFLLRKDQLLTISEIFVPHFLDLIHRPSASFCCEALILRLGKEATDDDSAVETLHAISDQINSKIVNIISHPFASHVLRVLLLILAGSSFEPDQIPSLLKKRKDDDSSYQKAVVILKKSAMSSQTSEQEQVNKLITQLSRDLDPPTAQQLALSSTASPVFQIILDYELMAHKTAEAKPSVLFIACLLPNEDVEGENLPFLQTLLHDSVGSHLMEVLVAKSPGRIFKRLHRGIFDGKILALAQNKGPASFVLVKAIERFSSGNLEKAVQEIVSGLAELVNTGETIVITSLIEQCRKRQVEVGPLSNGFKDEELIKQILEKPQNDGEDLPVRVSIMMQTMLAAPDGLKDAVIEGLQQLSQDKIFAMSNQPAASRLLQAALAPDQPAFFRKQLIANFQGKITELGQHNIASHVVDALWTGSSGLKFLRDRLISEVLANEQTLRQTISGRAVCRNWRKWSRETELEEKPLTGLDKARKRHAMAAMEKDRKRARN